MSIWIPLIALVVTITSLALLADTLFRRFWKKPSKTRNAAQNLLLSVFSLAYLFLILEAVFANFFIHSDGFGFTLASQRWFETYWNPINSDGYRDAEHQWNREHILFIVGDSFVAGHGIKYISNRFSGVLADKLGNDWTVAVIADNGWGPQQEYLALANHRKKPDRIIVSYFINDIQNAAKKNKIKRPRLIEKPNKWIRPLVENSFVLNWFYWRLYRGGSQTDVYWNYLKRAYSDDKTWKTHERELQSLIDYAKDEGSEIAFLIWPSLEDIAGSKEITSKVAGFLQSKGVTIIDLTEYFKDRSPRSLVVNPMDAHPNEQINAEVAEILFQRLSPWN